MCRALDHLMCFGCPMFSCGSRGRGPKGYLGAVFWMACFTNSASTAGPSQACCWDPRVLAELGEKVSDITIRL